MARNKSEFWELIMNALFVRECPESGFYTSRLVLLPGQCMIEVVSLHIYDYDEYDRTLYLETIGGC